MANERAYEPVGTTLAVGSQTFCFVSIGGIGFAARDAIENTCLSNSEYITKQPQALKESGDLPFTALWDPSEFADIEAEINDNQELVFTVAGLGTITFYGFLQTADISEAGPGDRWEISGNIVITNLTDGNVETGPVYAAAP